MVQTNIKHLKVEDYTGNMKKAVAYLLENFENFKTQEVGKHEVVPEFFYMIQEYQSKDTVPWEAHKKYIDIQVVLSGEEIMCVSGIHDLKQLGEYDESSDFIGFEGKALISMIMKAGDIAVFYPEDVHQPGLKTETMPIKKCVMKVLV